MSSCRMTHLKLKISTSMLISDNLTFLDGFQKDDRKHWKNMAKGRELLLLNYWASPSKYHVDDRGTI